MARSKDKGKTKGKAKGEGAAAGAPAGARRRRAPLVDRLTTLVLVLFLGSLAVPHLVP